MTDSARGQCFDSCLQFRHDLLFEPRMALEPRLIARHRTGAERQMQLARTAIAHGRQQRVESGIAGFGGYREPLTIIKLLVTQERD